VILARWLATKPRLLILDEPTRGIDVGATADIERLLSQLRSEGLALVLITSETSELARNSQRVIVLRDRVKVGELTGEAINEQAIMHAIAEGHVKAGEAGES
jgi:ABC-type sugar transport system ATPase subunit